MTRRNFILAILALATGSQLAKLYPFQSRITTPSNDGVVMRDGWILSETDL